MTPNFIPLLLLLQPFYSSLNFVQYNRGELIPFSHPLSVSSIYYDPWHPSCSIYMHDSLFAQSLSQVLFGLPLGLVLFTSYSIHLFIQSLSSFHNTCPYHRNPFCCSTEIMSSNSTLSLNPLLGTLSCSLMPHIRPFSSLPTEMPPQFPFLRARSHFHATHRYYFTHNCSTISLSLAVIYPYW